ncbi:MAG: hypothetical protein AAF850_05390 [Pseudomonadota bacterium]
MMKIEAVFGGVLALFVFAIAIYSLANTKLTARGGSSVVSDAGPSRSIGRRGGAEKVSAECRCFDDAFKLAGSDVGVMSAQYRTGFEQCREVLGVKGGEAWTDGWNARLSAKPYEATCRRYRR